MLCILLENIITPIKYVCVATFAATGVDEFTFKSWYKKLERAFPAAALDYKHAGFVFASSKKLFEDAAAESKAEVNNG